MMDWIASFGGVFANVITGVCLLAGSFFVVVGGIGTLRFPDFFTRLHAGGITDTMGAGLILVGLMFQAGFSLVLLKVAMILLFMIVTGPTACHALAHSALAQGYEPQTVTRSSRNSADQAP